MGYARLSWLRLFHVACVVCTVIASGASLVVAAAAASATNQPRAASTSATTPGAAAKAAAAGSASGAAAPTVVTLPTGDKIAVSRAPDGRQEASLLPGSQHKQFSELQIAGDLYVIPQAAISGSGASFDPSRFDVTQLAAGGSATPRPATARPSFVQYTLTVNGIDGAGQPDQGDAVLLVSADDARRFSQIESFYQGQFRASVPAGTYALVSFFYDFQAQVVRAVVLPQMTVTAARTVTLDARTATVPITVRTARPASSVEEEVTVDRAAKAAGDASYSFLASGQQLTWYATPTQPVTIGKLHYYVYDRLYSPAGVAPAYEYAVVLPAEGAIPASQAYTVSQGQLATQQATYYSDGQPRPSLETRFSFLPWEFSNFRADSPFTRPLQRTEYYTGGFNIVWQTYWIAYFDLSTFTFSDYYQDSYHLYAPGQRTSATWLAGPLGNGIGHDNSTPFIFGCPACREPGKLDLFIWPAGDNGAGHVGYLDPADKATYKIYENSKRIVSGSGELIGLFPVPARQETYHVVYDITRTQPWWTQSTSSHTDWTFRSAAEKGPAPKGWACLDGSVKCTPVPLLTASYRLAADLLGQEPPGPASFRLNIGHLQDSAAPAVTSVSAAVSFDGGKTWTAAHIAGRRGIYTASYVNPAASQASGHVAIRISAGDAGGGAFTQTVLSAYAITGAATGAPASPPGSTTSPWGAAPSAFRSACPSLKPLQARCLALVRPSAVQPSRASLVRDGKPNLAHARVMPQGYGPASLQAAYKLPVSRGSGRTTIAVVDAFDDPSAEADLNFYRATYGLPACTVANGCFAKVNEGGAPAGYPPPDPGWALEISLDLDMVSAACPKCHILLVEAFSANVGDLGTGDDTAVRLGATAVSNSYGAQEFGGMQQFAAFYDHPGTTITASSGDAGFGTPSYPAVFPTVLAVGGTSLHGSHNHRGWSEQAWSGAGSGCSAWIAKPAWQHDGHCFMRTVADVSAVADPNTGVAVFDSLPFLGRSGWWVVGGTSVSSPLIAAVVGLAGNGGVAPSYPYQHASALYDARGGSNGFCGSDYLCTGTSGYDGPTGLGTPHGAGAF